MSSLAQPSHLWWVSWNGAEVGDWWDLCWTKLSFLPFHANTTAAWRIFPSSFASHPFLLSLSTNTCTGQVANLQVGSVLFSFFRAFFTTRVPKMICMSVRKKNTWKSQHFTIQRKCEKSTVQMFIQSRSPKRRRSRNTISSNNLTCLLFSYSRSGRICLLCLESRRTKTR